MTQNNDKLRNPLQRQTRALAAALSVAFVVGTLVVPSGAGDTRNLDSFAKCLTSKKATMYGSFWCSHCDDQKKLFGDSFQYITYMECSMPGSRELSVACKFAQIRQTPTWIFSGGERVVGTQSLQNLSQKAGCALP